MGKAGNMLDMTKTSYCYVWTSVAAAASDNAKKTSAAIDRSNYGSCKLVIPYTTTLAEGKTLSFTIDVTDCATSGGIYASYSAIAKTVYETGGSGGGTYTDVITLDVNLNGAKQYLKVEITSDLSATGTDTATYGATLEMMDPVVAPV